MRVTYWFSHWFVRPFYFQAPWQAWMLLNATLTIFPEARVYTSLHQSLVFTLAISGLRCAKKKTLGIGILHIDSPIREHFTLKLFQQAKIFRIFSKSFQVFSLVLSALCIYECKLHCTWTWTAQRSDWDAVQTTQTERLILLLSAVFFDTMSLYYWNSAKSVYKGLFCWIIFYFIGTTHVDAHTFFSRSYVNTDLFHVIGKVLL